MSRSAVTLSDVARSLNLSTCTVSKILNRSFKGFSYSPETIRRVEKAAVRLNYTANAQARSLRTSKSMLVGFLLPSAEFFLFGALTDRLERELRTWGYQVLSVHSRNDVQEEKELIPTLLSRGIDGLIWIPSQSRFSPSEMGLRTGLPAIILDRPFCTTELPFVATDNRAAAQELAKRIRQEGHRSAVVINAAAQDRSMKERCQGMTDVFGKNLRTIDVPNDAAEAKKAILAFIGLEKKRPTVLVALSEALAIGTLAGLRELNMSIPSEISFAAFDDFPLASHWSPRITVVQQDLEKLASQSAQLLLQRMKSPRKNFENIRIPAQLVWRESVGRPPF
jgi:DNA-binding LacI/PurR family transcriptional regulator